MIYCPLCECELIEIMDGLVCPNPMHDWGCLRDGCDNMTKIAKIILDDGEEIVFPSEPIVQKIVQLPNGEEYSSFSFNGEEIMRIGFKTQSKSISRSLGSRYMYAWGEIIK